MISRAFGITLAAVAGAPLLAALLVSCCPSTTAAVIACLALAAGGVLGAVVGAQQISAALPAQRTAPADFDASLDAETRAALLRLGEKCTPQSELRNPQSP